MKARASFCTRRASGMLAGALALVLISTASSGPAWAITGGEPDGHRHPNVGAIIVYNPADDAIHTVNLGTQYQFRQ